MLLHAPGGLGLLMTVHAGLIFPPAMGLVTAQAPIVSPEEGGPAGCMALEAAFASLVRGLVSAVTLEAGGRLREGHVALS